MQLLITAALLLLIWLVVCFFGHGFWNTVDVIAFWMHRAAANGRESQMKRSAVMEQKWREAHPDGVPFTAAEVDRVIAKFEAASEEEG